MKSDRPLVSIVTPVLNRARRIRACLSSVAAQSYPAVEHIVIDGGSTDGTLDVLRELSDEHTVRWISEPDSGMYDAINKGLGLARGDVLAYLNSDDFYLPWSVEVAVAALARGSDIAFGDLGILTFPTDDDTYFFIQTYPPFDPTYYTYVSALGQPTVFWRRSITERIGGFDTRFRQVGDCEYWLRAATRGAQFLHVSEVMAVQVEHASTLRATRADELASEYQQLRREYSAMIPRPIAHSFRVRQRGLRWRWNQVLFMLESLQKRPVRWSRFIRFLRDNELELMPPARALGALLPARLRSRRAMYVDMSPLERKLGELIGSQDSFR